MSASAGRSAIESVLASYPNATLMDQVQYKAQQAKQVNQLLNLVYGLLALAVVIALIGIANTLALSIHERTRELGLLRAVGTTRGQLRSTVCLRRSSSPCSAPSRAWCSGCCSAGQSLPQCIPRGSPTWCSPSGELLALAGGAGLAGMVAAIAPSRRAARLNVLRAVTTE